MVQTRKDRKRQANGIKLAQPDRSAPSDQTLLDFAQERDLFEQAELRRRKLGYKPEVEDDEPGDAVQLGSTADRILETILWSVSLSTLHFTLDVLVQNQYAVELSLPTVFTRTARALVVFTFLLYILHPHPSSTTLVPGLPDRAQAPLRQAIFFVTSVFSGCYLIYISSTYGYIAVMKQSPPLGCLWVWSVIELNLVPATLSLVLAGAYFWFGGYKI